LHLVSAQSTVDLMKRSATVAISKGLTKFLIDGKP
jgi:hypothetical protein